MSKRKKNNVKKGSDYLISPENKVKLFGIFLAIASVFVFLSILSYSRYDWFISDLGFFDLFKVFGNNPDFNKRLLAIHNWMGIFGAYISYFLVLKTIGYFSIVFPIISFIWSLSVLGKKNYSLVLKASNFLLAAGVLLAAFFGALRFSPDIQMFTESKELAGNVGDFLGRGFSLLFGGLGSVLILSALMAVLVVFSFNLPVVEWFQKLKEKFTEEERPAESGSGKDLMEDEKKRIKKIEELSNRKKKAKKKEIPAEEPEPMIKIIRKDKEDVVEQKQVEAKPAAEAETASMVKKEEFDEPIDILKEEQLPEQWEEKLNYVVPTIDLLDMHPEESSKISEEELKRNAELLKEKLKLFDITIENISVTPGPVVTLYEIVPSPGIKISRIVSLENDIALALAARGIRIIAPIPGKSAIGVEIPNANAALVSARSVLAKLKESRAELPMALGKTIAGDVYIADLATMPHLLIAGATGSGKSVGINMIINSLLFTKDPSEIKFVIIDPKKIELSYYKLLRKHFLAVSPDINEEIITNPQNALIALKAVEFEMEKRYDKLAKAGVRNIVDYNKKISNPRSKPKDTDSIKHYKMPYIIVIIDELADLMITAGKEVEEPIGRLAQLARAVGIHLIVATQRPSVNVITGVIKANFSARIAYKVATKIDSRTILDQNGAEQLLGRGDMLFLPVGVPKPIRIQNAFISTEEVERVAMSIYKQQGYSKRFLLPSMFEKKKSASGNFLSEVDPMFEDAARIIVKYQQGSVSLLQRRLKLGYARAARIVDQLEQAGIVGASLGSKAREVLVESEEELETILRSL